MSPIFRAIPVALLMLTTSLAASQPAERVLLGSGFYWDQLAPQYWQPRARVLTASVDLGSFKA